MEKDFPKDGSYTGQSDEDIDITDKQMLLKVQILSLKEEIEKDEEKSPKTIEEKEQLQRDKERLKELKIEYSVIRKSQSKSASSTDKPPVSEFSFANLQLPDVSTGRLFDIFNDPDSTRHQRSETRESSQGELSQIEGDEIVRKQSPFLSNLLDKSCETTALEQFMNPPQTEQADLQSTSGLINIAGFLSSSEESSQTSPGERDDSPTTSDETLPSDILEPKPSTSYAVLEPQKSKSYARLETRSLDEEPEVSPSKRKGKGIMIGKHYVTKLSPLKKPEINSPIKPSHGVCSPTETKTLEVENQSPKSEFVASDEEPVDYPGKGKGIMVGDEYVTKLSPAKKPETNSPIKPSQLTCSPTETKTLKVENQSPQLEFVARTSPPLKRKIPNSKEKDCDESCTGISTDSQLSETRSCDEIKISKKLKFEDEDANKQFPTLTEERQPLDSPNTGVLSNVVGFTSISNSEESSLTSGSGEIVLGEREDSSLTNVSDVSPEIDSPITSLGEETSTSGNSELQHSPSIDMSPKPMDEMGPVTNMEL